MCIFYLKIETRKYRGFKRFGACCVHQGRNIQENIAHWKFKMRNISIFPKMWLASFWSNVFLRLEKCLSLWCFLGLGVSQRNIQKREKELLDKIRFCFCFGGCVFGCFCLPVLKSQQKGIFLQCLKVLVFFSQKPFLQVFSFLLLPRCFFSFLPLQTSIFCLVLFLHPPFSSNRLAFSLSIFLSSFAFSFLIIACFFRNPFLKHLLFQTQLAFMCWGCFLPLLLFGSFFLLFFWKLFFSFKLRVETKRCFLRHLFSTVWKVSVVLLLVVCFDPV